MALDTQLITGLVAAAVTFVGTYVATYVKWRKDLVVEYDKDLRNKRIDAYRELWKQLQPLARYARPARLTPARLVMLSINLRRWYFETGGLFLSTESRDRYFDLQKGIKVVFKQHAKFDLKVVEGLVEELPASPPGSPPEVRVLSSPLAPPPEVWAGAITETEFGTLQKLGSALRTALSNDVGTRKASALVSS